VAVTLDALGEKVDALIYSVDTLRGSLGEFRGFCREDMRLHEARLQVLEKAQVATETEEGIELRRIKIRPHWHIAKATYMLGLFTFLLALDIILRIFAHVRY